MTDRPFIFRKDNLEMVLPVTPSSYQVEKGINIEVVNIHELGDAIMTGYGTLATIKIDFLLPTREYPFSLSSDPEPYITQIESWLKERDRLRFIVGGTQINIPVIIEHLNYGEQDGTNDIYASIVLREYRDLATVQVQTSPAASAPRESPTAVLSQTVENYLIKPGDTLSGICRKYYGDGSAAVYKKLAAYNDIKNPHLIIAGKTIKIPKPMP